MILVRAIITAENLSLHIVLLQSRYSLFDLFVLILMKSLLSPGGTRHIDEARTTTELIRLYAHILEHTNKEI